MGATINRKSAGRVVLSREMLCRLVFAFIFIFMLYYLYSNSMVHQLQSPVLKFPYVDLTYWGFHLLGIPEFITRDYFTSCCFDILLFAFCILSFIFPARRTFIIVFFILFFIYFIIFNSYGTHHTHSRIGILLMPVPFMLNGKKRFEYGWEAMRYFTIFVYADAFLWKLFRFAFLTKDHGILIIKKNLAPYIYYHPQTNLTKLYYWLFDHPILINCLFITGFFLEGFFLVGFFTKRMDKYLFVISLILPAGFLFLSDAFFFEMLVLSFTLIYKTSASNNAVMAV